MSLRVRRKGFSRMWPSPVFKGSGAEGRASHALSLETKKRDEREGKVRPAFGEGIAAALGACAVAAFREGIVAALWAGTVVACWVGCGAFLSIGKNMLCSSPPCSSPLPCRGHTPILLAIWVMPIWKPCSACRTDCFTSFFTHTMKWMWLSMIIFLMTSIPSCRCWNFLRSSEMACPNGVRSTIATSSASVTAGMARHFSSSA